jgi:hypothetical protein
MVPVCKDFRRYADYVKKHFPEEINSRAVYFITMIAVIQTINDIYSSILLGPEEWLKKLGTTKYKKYMPTIVDLQIIWSFTLGILDETPYAEYVTLRNNALEDTKEAFEDALINYMETESIASLKEDKSTSSVSSSIYKLKPPPYTRHSPIVQGDAASLQSNKSDKSRKSQKHTSSRGYHTTTPNPINSQGDALCSFSKRAKKNNGSIQSNDDMDEDLYNEPDQWDIDLGRKPIKSIVINKKDTESVVSQRSLRFKPARHRSKFDTVKWDGMKALLDHLRELLKDICCK